MELVVHGPAVHLDAGQVLTLDDAAGARICPRAGIVWVTEENSITDHIVAQGDCYTVRKAGRAVVQAFAPAWLDIQ